jgi:integrase
MLAESAPRAGFFESEQFASVRRHLPEELQPVVTFAYHTGCRMQSEILSLEWRNVEFRAGEIRLDTGTAKNGDGRVFPMTNDLPTCLQAEHAEHERLKTAGHLFPFVFFREVATHAEARSIRSRSRRLANRGRRRVARPAVRARPPADGGPELGPRWDCRARRDEDDGAQNAECVARYNIVSDGDLREAAAS